MTQLRIAGRPLSASDLSFIRAVIAERDDWSRWALSRELAGRMGWYSPTGQLKDMACRELLVKLARDGLVAVPAPRRLTPSPRRLRPPAAVAHDQTPVEGVLARVQPIVVEVVSRGSAADGLLRHLLASYHYLGLDRPTGATVRYLLRGADGRLLGGALWSSPAWKTAARDGWIGWDADRRALGLQSLVNNTRYLILPWVRVPHLASHVLALMQRRVVGDWQAAYGREVVLAETFVDRSRYAGTCYLAAGWQCLGETKGRTRDDRRNQIAVARKTVFVKPLCRDWHQRLFRSLVELEVGL